MPRCRASARALSRAAAGFGYLSVIVTIAIFTLGLAAIGEMWSTQAQRDREAELLHAGRAVREAIISYYASTTLGKPAYPARLEDLLEDRRGPTLRRHLRKIYIDPMTGDADWILITTPDGRIRGIHSRSQRAPLRNVDFGPMEYDFDKAATYAGWRFEHVVRSAPPRGPQR